MTENSRAKRLKSDSHQVHDSLDKAIMAAEPFADRQRYIRFLQVQHAFHRDIAALYEAPALTALIDRGAGAVRPAGQRRPRPVGR